MKKLSQSGFTLIELIITIVIIGVLAAVAIPKFQSLTNDAEKGVAAGVAAAVASATSVNYGRSKVPNAVACGGGTVTNCYYTITDCSTLATAAPLIADIPTGYAVAGTATLTPDGTATTGCTITKTGVTPVAFSAYGAV